MGHPLIDVTVFLEKLSQNEDYSLILADFMGLRRMSNQLCVSKLA